MFGQSTPNPFGQLNASGAQKSSIFGAVNSQTQQGNSPFTQPSLFGNPTQTNSPFGTTSNTSQATSIFGSPAASNFNSAGASIFGNNKQDSGSSFSSAFGSTMSTPGTTVKFSAPIEVEQGLKSGNFSQSTINARLQCITCMQEYKAKSLEELRLEDYNANRKGPSSQQQSNSLFGSAPKPSGNSLFGSMNTVGSSVSTGGSLFNQNQNKSIFASTAPTSTTSSFFGSNNSNTNTNKSSSIFGQPSAATNINTFGQSNAFGTSALASPFGATMNSQPQQNSLFGTTQSSNTLFGNISQPSSIFGAANSGQTNAFGSAAPTTSTPSIFGSNNVNANKPPALFGQNPTTNTFGSQPNAFGTSTSTSFGTVNSQPQQGAQFGQTSANSIFSANPTQPIFGAANNSFGSLAPTTTSASIFGSNFNTNRPTLLSQNPTTNTFGGQPNTFGGTTQPQFGPFNPQPQQSFTGQYSTPSLYSTNLDSDRIITRLQALPYGSPQFLIDNSSLPKSIKTHFTTDPKTLNQYKINATSHAEVKSQRVPSTRWPTTLFDGLDDESPENLKCWQDVFSPRPNIKKLVLDKGNALPFKGASSPHVGGSKTSPALSNNNENRSPELNTNLALKQTTQDTIIEAIDKPVRETTIQSDNTPTSSSTEKSLTPEQQLTAAEENVAPSSCIPKCGIILNRSDYYTIPPLEECDAYYDAKNDSCILECFTVGRVDYGSIYWNGPLDVKGINLDEIVHIRRKEVIVYPDDDDKPPLGEGLNRPAQVTLDQVWPIDKTTRKTIKDSARLRAMKYPEKVEAATIKMDAIFKEYRPDTGSWVFNVKHFSKYALI